jgi:cell division transport system ATP-binding protein
MTEALLAAPAAAPAAAPLLEMERVEQRYGEFRPALVGIDLRVARGDFVVVSGPGGSGKSVLLRLLAGLELPAGGRIRIAGEDLAAMRPRLRVRLRRSMGILPADLCLLDRRSVTANVALAAWVAGVDAEEGRRRALAALALVGLDPERADATPCGRLAAGERHRVALARALVNRPALLLLDDLLAPLDEPTAGRVLQVLEQFCAAGVTVIATSRRTPLAPAPDATLAAGGVPPWPARARQLQLRDGRMQA